MTGSARDAQADCRNLVARFAYYVDHHLYEDMAGLFTSDCRFERPGATLNGRAELLAFMQKRPADAVSRHVCTPSVFLETGPDRMTGVSYLTFFEGELADPIARLTGATAVAEYHDDFVLTSDGWRIAHRKVVPVMIAPKAA